MVVGDQFERVIVLWDEHMGAAFPERLRGEEINGAEMVLADADAAGCIQSWLTSRGTLDPQRRAWIIAMLAQLNQVLPALTDPREARYFSRLRDMIALICDDPPR
jgi:hypothetical protein